MPFLNRSESHGATPIRALRPEEQKRAEQIEGILETLKGLGQL